MLVWACAGAGVALILATLFVLAVVDDTATPLAVAGGAILATGFIASIGLYLIRRRKLAAGFAAAWGSLAFMSGGSAIFALGDLSDDPAQQLADLNIIIGTAVGFVAFGGLLTYQAATALGGVTSRPLAGGWRWALLLVPLAPAILVGQWLVADPERAPWLFPAVNLAVVAIPSLVLAALAARLFRRANPLAWPVTAREWFAAIAYGAIWATTVAGTINSIYIVGMSEWLQRVYDVDAASALPRGVGIFHDLSPLSLVAPLNEELWKGLIVAAFAYRRGSAARAFLWGVLAGAGFNILETFVNSLASVQPDLVGDEELRERWWLFGTARTGAAAIHSASTGLAALAFYGILRRRWALAPLFLVGVAIHASWNGLIYLLVGDQLETGAGPDSLALDFAAIGGLIGVAVVSVVLVLALGLRLREGRPMPLYRAIGMAPSRDARLRTGPAEWRPRAWT